MSKWRLPELIQRYKQHRANVVTDGMWDKLNENQLEIARQRRTIQRLEAENRELVARLRAKNGMSHTPPHHDQLGTDA